ncbi:hypothetical protein DXG03_002180 [Asterophora parasitica]|uniref:Uncharacterized protein n=1 Tax=Asterophora parasitica TaxID=117018 RepID=A0A9P7GDQ0_9AGAR|nr:hypothetical protein DXG03_002180 [Asterophora parasitica]
MPRPHRGGSACVVRPHSRSSSSSKLGANLQFTQKEQLPLKGVDKPKKNGTGYDNNQPNARGITRVASAQRVHSREHVQPFVPKQRAPPHTHKNNGGRGKAGFTISSPGEDDDDDDWVSSESGAATPSNNQSGSETESDDNIPDEEAIRRIAGERPPHTAPTVKGTRSETPVLPRVETARPSDFRPPVVTNPPQPQPQHEPEYQRHETRPEARTPTFSHMKTSPLPHLQHIQPQNHRSFDNETISEHPTPEAPSRHPNPRTSTKRQASTRPPSSHSIRGDQALRPHPLIRGHSYGQVYPAKPAPLEPLTVIQDASTSTSPPEFDGSQLSTSPTSSIQTDLASPEGYRGGQRRTSVSSARSVATLPVHSGLRDSVNWSLGGDRRRTLSTVSNSASSAALSSLVHLPTVTRPPSPQAIAFFPPVNPHANIEGIHPLLPGPYLNNHLTVLARRTPIKEAFDRVIRAKQIRT